MKTDLKNGIFGYNPVLVQCVGLCTVIMGTENLQSAIISCIFLLVDVVCVSCIGSAFLKGFSRFFRVALYFLTGALLVYPGLYFLESYTFISMSYQLKICICLMPAGSITALIGEKIAMKRRVKETFFFSLSQALGAAAVMLPMGFIRELLAQGTVFGVKIDVPFKLSAAQTPFACLILLGFFAVIFRLFSGKGGDEE